MIQLRNILLGLAVAAVILCAVQPAVRADGIPMVKIELHGTLRENRQIAYVSVDKEGRYETLDLFLNVVSLEPGNPLSIMIPLRTRPSTVTGGEMTEYQFRTERNFNVIEDTVERQNHAVGRVAERTADAASFLAKCQVMGIFYFMVIGMGGGASGSEHYEIAEGVSMDMLSFNSSESLGEYYASQGMEMPAEVEEIIARYGSFNVGVINAVTRPPIDGARFDAIATQYPIQLAEFKTFVAQNPSIKTYGHGYYPSFGYDVPELAAILRSIGDESMRWSFSELMAATYGYSQASGTLISFHLPLHDGLAFFPLGTTPAWHGVQKTEVIFRIEDTKTIDFNRAGHEAFLDGSHYYLWDFDAQSPDYDLEGKVKDSGFMDGLNRFGRRTEQWVYDRSESFGMILGGMLLIGLWSGFLWTSSRLRGWAKGGKWQAFQILILGGSCFMSSMLFTIVIGISIAAVGMVLLESRYLPQTGAVPNRIRPKSILSAVLAILLLITGFVCLLGVIFTHQMPIYSLPLAIGLLGVVFIGLHKHLSNDPSDERKIGAWLLYLGMMVPSFLLVNSVSYGEAICTTTFVIFMLIQTGIYVQIMRMEEDEPGHIPVRWESERSEPPIEHWQPKKA